MKFFSTVATSLLIFTLASCSSVSKKDCSKDMWLFGYDNGRKGLSSLIEDLRKTCGRNNPSLNLGAYESGLAAGWSEFCTPFNGYRMGAKGDLYKSFCPPERENLFHERFLIGKNVYEKKDQVRELQEKIMDLSEDGKELTSPSSREELSRYKNELRDLNKEIQALEQRGMSNAHLN